MEKTEVALAVQALTKKILLVACVMSMACVLSSCSANARKEREVREQAITFMAQGDYSAAVARFDEALSYHDGKNTDLEIDILRYRAEAEVLAGDYAAAANTFAMLRREDEDKSEYKNLQIICMVKDGKDVEKAAEIYEEVEAKEPTSIGHKEALYALGTALTKSGNEESVEKATELYEKALDFDELKTGELYNRIGSLVFAKGKIDEAIGWFQDGIYYINNHSYAEGEDDERDVLQSLQYNIAICYEYKQEYRKAYDLFKEYVESYGTSDTIEHEMAFLESRIR